MADRQRFDAGLALLFQPLTAVETRASEEATKPTPGVPSGLKRRLKGRKWGLRWMFWRLGLLRVLELCGLWRNNSMQMAGG
jgi:hypothetical protein